MNLPNLKRNNILHKNSIFYDIIFIVLLISTAFIYQYFDVLNTAPNGIHNWRQTDGASIAYIYYEEGNSFFEPEMHNRLSGEGKAVGEFPIMYYIVSIGYHIFGYHHWVYRLIWLITVLSGIFCLYKFSEKILHDKFWGMFVALVSFASPVFVVYGISYIPDPIALSFLFISWYFIFCYVKQPILKYLIPAIVFVTLAALIKITSLISIIAFGSVVIMILAVQRIRYQISTKKLLKKTIPFLIVGIIIIAWYVFAMKYNEKHQTSYFFMKIAPFWKVESVDLNAVNDRILGWMREYYYPSGLHVLYAMAALLIIPFFNQYLKRSYYFLYIFSLIGFLCFIILFYTQFEYHDYYVINLLFIVPLTYIMFFKKYKEWIEKKMLINTLVRISAGFLLVVCTIHTHKRVKERFAFKDGWLDEDLYELRHKLSEFGISKDDLILVPHDPSPNITLYAVNLKGWTQLNSINNPNFLEEKIKAGAKYMFVSDERFYDNPIIDPYRDNLVVDFKGIRIYKLFEN